MLVSETVTKVMKSPLHRPESPVPEISVSNLHLDFLDFFDEFGHHLGFFINDFLALFCCGGKGVSRIADQVV